MCDVHNKNGVSTVYGVDEMLVKILDNEVACR
jgi:hypothetical protein